MSSGSFSLFPGSTNTGSNQYSDTSYPMSAVNPTAQMTNGGASPVPANLLGPNQTAPGVVPPSSTAAPLTNTFDPSGVQGPNQPAGPLGGIVEQPNQGKTVSPLYPDFTNAFYNFLSQQMGKGATPFNLSAALPSAGGAPTAPGTLAAPLTDVNQMLENFYKTGSGGPTGTDTLAGMASTGAPTDVGPAWEAMKAAQQRTIAEQGANLREQFAFGGDLKSSPFGQAATDFYSQTAKDENALLTQAQQQAQEAAAGRKLSASSDLTSGASNMGQYLQGLDQASLQSTLAEFIRTQPEYAPYLNMLFGASTTFPPAMSGTVGVGGLGGALGSAGSALSGIADLWGTIKDSGGGGTNSPSAPNPGAINV